MMQLETLTVLMVKLLDVFESSLLPKISAVVMNLENVDDVRSTPLMLICWGSSSDLDNKSANAPSSDKVLKLLTFQFEMERGVEAEVARLRAGDSVTVMLSKEKVSRARAHPEEAMRERWWMSWKEMLLIVTWKGATAPEYPKKMMGLKKGWSSLSKLDLSTKLQSRKVCV